VGGPGPAPVQAQPQPASAGGQPGGGVQQPVAKRFGFGFGQCRHVVQQAGLGPGEQVDRRQGGLQPDGVDGEAAGGYLEPIPECL